VWQEARRLKIWLKTGVKKHNLEWSQQFHLRGVGACLGGVKPFSPFVSIRGASHFL